ncbi:hypothetical protein PM022_16435 [Halorubrum ezzemoulense]|uniref:hypothetical protein n=1 Tax=Halorubrum ezzemoulense TaxID=337243 RepID=UPI0023312EFF|nr:hypothetical protein [Halorubrum ezzemoulense]MDB2276097.1 hypothetical protein [Halorubrum ezzemoulense]
MDVDESELNTLSEYGDGIYIRTTEGFSPPFVVSTNNDDYVRGGYVQAIVLVSVITEYGEPRELSDDVVPASVAVDGRPAISAYLYSVNEWSKEELAQLLDVQKETVTKYISRFRRSETEE